jgi:hypothetical protein
LESKNNELKSKLEDSLLKLARLETSNQNVAYLEQKQKLDHDKLHEIIGDLMNEAALKTKQEVESLRKIYNANIEKLIEECNILETVGVFSLFY